MRRYIQYEKTILFIYISMLFVVTAKAQSFVLQGRVTDEQMNPIELASVACPQQGKITMTSLKGEFSMNLHSADSVVIRFPWWDIKQKPGFYATLVANRPSR